MKIVLIVFLFIGLLLTACGREADENGSADILPTQASEVIVPADTGNVLKGVDVNTLCLMTVGEAIDILGTKHNTPKLFSDFDVQERKYRYSMICQIEYEDSCVISFSKTDIDGDGLKFVPQTDLERGIEAIIVHQKIEIYKGISVGKTLDEINSNPDLLNKLEVLRDEKDDSLSAECYYTYNDVLMFMTLGLDENLKCTEIQIFTYGDSLL